LLALLADRLRQPRFFGSLLDREDVKQENGDQEQFLLALLADLLTRPRLFGSLLARADVKQEKGRPGARTPCSDLFICGCEGSVTLRLLAQHRLLHADSGFSAAPSEPNGDQEDFFLKQKFS
jgi:hypothetical protein